MNEVMTQEVRDLSIPVDPAGAGMEAWKRQHGLIPGVAFALQVAFNDQLYTSAERFSKRMSQSPMMPKHCKGSEPACFQILCMAADTGLSPFVIATKTFEPIPGSGVLGFMAELVLMLVNRSGFVKGDDIRYEAVGDWGVLTGKFRDEESKKKTDEHGKPVKYKVAAYSRADEKGLGIRVHIPWTDRPTYVSPIYWLENQHPRNSTLWATDPWRQMCYAALRTAVRGNRPEILAGARFEDDEDLYQGEANAKVIGSGRGEEDEAPAGVVTPRDVLDAFAGGSKKKDQPAEDAKAPDDTAKAPAEGDKPKADAAKSKADSGKKKAADDKPAPAANGNGAKVVLILPTLGSDKLDPGGVPIEWTDAPVPLGRAEEAFGRAFAACRTVDAVQAIMTKNMTFMLDDKTPTDVRKKIDERAADNIEDIKRTLSTTQEADPGDDDPQD